MNKTVNINLGGLFFHIDEDAFQKLNRYFDAIKRSLSNASGQDEIMKDIVDRDERDMNRAVSPLKKAEDAVLVDSSEMGIDEVVESILSVY